jgi:hypothetical protein
MHALGVVASEVKKETVARFRSMESNREFLVTGKFDEAGVFVLDEEIEAMAGPFATFAVDGSTAKFLGLDSLRIIETEK